MPRLDWYAFYVADYRADTRHLTPMQHFAYRELLDEIFLAGQHEQPPSISSDDDYLRSICRPNSDDEWTTTRRVLINGPRALLKLEDGRLYQKRMSHEVEKALTRSEKAKAAIETRWEKARSNAPESTNSPKAIATHGPNGDRAATGRGNGSALKLTDSQWVFIATRAGKWMDEHRELWSGEEWPRGWEGQFKRSVGVSYADYERRIGEK